MSTLRKTVSRRATLAGGLALVVAQRVRAADAPEGLAITPELEVAAKKEGTLTLQYTSPLVTMQGFIKAFTKSYPSINVNLERKAGTSGVYALEEELKAGVRRVDVFQGSDVAASQDLIDRGAFVAFAPANMADFSPLARSMAPYLLYPDRLRNLIAYNPSFVKDEQAALLRSWTGVLDPQFHGMISLCEPTFGVTMAPLLYVMNTKELGEDFLRKLKSTQKPNIYVDTAQARNALVSGQQPISWGAQWDSVVLTEIARGSPMRFVFPDPTVEWAGDAWGVLRTSPHPNASRLLLAWVMSRDGALAEEAPYSNVLSNMTGIGDVREAMKQVANQAWYAAPKNFWRPDLQDWIHNGPKFQTAWSHIMQENG